MNYTVKLCGKYGGAKFMWQVWGNYSTVKSCGKYGGAKLMWQGGWAK